ncbi:MAG: transglycosylase domain-containing protein [Actinobacteria bacterium]|nr:transglycosylase domain-containing protein [Actinomycetota bacterium]
MRLIARTWWILLAAAVSAWILVIGAELFEEVPLPEAAPPVQSSTVYDIDGRRIGSFHGEENRTLTDLDEISKNLRDAAVAAEDQEFYDHPGVSVPGIIRAAYANFRAGTVTQGASTITQQYARTFETVGKEQTLTRKLREATLAIKIEREFSKDKILEFYLNTVYFGRGAYGAEAAAQTYFKKPAGELDLAEAAYLAGIIRSPNRYQIEDNPDGVPSIAHRVLDSMVAAGFIEPAEAGAAKAVNLAERFQFGASVEQASPVGGYFIEYVRKLLISDYGIEERDLLGAGLKIHTTLDLDMQVAAEQAVASTLDQPSDPEAALLAMDPQGRVKAMVGGRVVDDLQRARGTNFAANLPGETGGRQPGSALKPVALAAFVDEGKSVKSKFLGPSPIELRSSRCRNADQTPWTVANFANASYGEMDLIEATVRSANTVYAQMMDQVVSPEKFISVAGRLGIEIPEGDRGCALTLGTTDVTPLEMARAYATFAARGRRPEPLMVLKVESDNGETLVERAPRTEQTLSQDVADVVNHILKQNVQRGTGTAAKLPWPAMGKTGTAQNFSDASFAGATPELTAVVWMGYPPGPETGVIPTMEDVRGRSVTGGSFPATIWREFMLRALEGVQHSDFVEPERFGGQVLEPQPCSEVSSSADPESGDAGASRTPGDEPTPASQVCVEPSPEPGPSPSPSPAGATPRPSASPLDEEDISPIRRSPSPPAEPECGFLDLLCR